jgi:hypothetical protein
LQANLQPLQQGACTQKTGTSAPSDDHLLKLTRFWLQNAFKLATALPACLTPAACSVFDTTLALHACLSLEPCAEGDEAASHDAQAARHRSVSSQVSQYLLARCRYCCAVALAALPKQDAAHMISGACAADDAKAAQSGRLQHALLSHMGAGQRASAMRLGAPLMLAGLLTQAADFPSLTELLHHMDAPRVAFHRLAELPHSLASLSHACAISAHWLQSLSSDVATAAGGDSQLSGLVQQGIIRSASAHAARTAPLLRAVASRVIAVVTDQPGDGVAAATELALGRLRSSAAAAALLQPPEAFATAFGTCVACAVDVWQVGNVAGANAQAWEQHFGAESDILADPVASFELASAIVAAPADMGPAAALAACCPVEDGGRFMQAAIDTARWALHCACTAGTPASALATTHCAASLSLATALKGGLRCSAHASHTLLSAAEVGLANIASEVLHSHVHGAAVVMALTCLQSVRSSMLAALRCNQLACTSANVRANCMIAGRSLLATSRPSHEGCSDGCSAHAGHCISSDTA